MKYQVSRLVTAVLLMMLLIVSAAAVQSAVVVYLDEFGSCYGYEHPNAYDAESALNLLAYPPSPDMTGGKTLSSAVLPMTRVLSIRAKNGVTSVDFSLDIIGEGLGEARLTSIFEQVKATLYQFDMDGNIKLTAGGKTLSEFVSRPAEITPIQAENLSAPLVGTGLGGKRITLSPGHGKRWNGSSWATARPVYCSPLNQEDYHNDEMMAYLKVYMEQDSADIKMVRCVDKNYGNSPWASNTPWWQMGACYWLQNIGYPGSVYGPGGTNLGTGGSDDTNEIQSRPLSSDYDNSNIYISLHTNGSSGDCSGSGCPTGTCTYYDAGTEHATWGAISQDLATDVNNAIISAIRTKYSDSGWSNRGVFDSDGGFGEIRIPNRAAILIELAFHDSCDLDAIKLRDNFFRSTCMWAIYKGTCDYFGVTPTYDYYSDEVVSHDIPTTMEVGQRYTVHVTMRNRGVLWNDAKAFHLGAVGDSDPFTTTTRQAISGEVGPNSTYTFTYQLRAPLTTGTYTTDWQMVRDGYQWFGPTVSQTIDVTGTPDTEAPTVPTNLTATAQDEMHVNLSWTASTDDRGVIGYNIYRNNVKIGTSATTSFSDGGCVPSTTYTYEVSAYDDFNNESGRSVSAQATTPAPSPPTTPQNVHGTASTTNSITFAWNASTDNIGVVGYRIYRNGAQVGTSTTTSYTDTGLNYTSSYTYEVDAYDGVPSYSGKSTPVVLSTQTPSYYTWTRTTSNADAYIRSGSVDTPGATGGIQSGWSSTAAIAIRRGMVRWDMTGAPSQAAVVSASNSVRVKMYCYLRSSNTAVNIDLRKVTADWTEANATWATMNAAYSGSFATASVGAVGDYTWSWNGNTGGLPVQNRGIQVYNQSETTNLMVKIFNDRADYGATGAATLPRLEIDYYDIVAPTGCSININSGAAYTTNADVTLTLAASDSPSGMSQMQFSTDGVNYSAAEAYATSKSITLPAGDGLKTVYVKYKDVSGNWSSPVSDTITLDTAIPTGTITINSDAAYAKSSPVTLTLTSADSAQMQFKNEEGAWSAWEAYSTTKSWALSSGDGLKIVYAQFKDAAGNISDTVSDEITLDTEAPTISIGAPSASSATTGPVTYEITYGAADEVTLADGNVTLNKTGTADGTAAVTGTGLTTRTVTISGITGNGTLGISVAAGTASDNAGNTALAAGPSATFDVANILQSYALINRSVTDEIMQTASINFLFTVWGKVTPIDANSFTVDDGSNMPVTVNFAGHGFTSLDYVSATGTLNVSGPSPVMNAQEVKKLN